MNIRTIRTRAAALALPALAAGGLLTAIAPAAHAATDCLATAQSGTALLGSQAAKTNTTLAALNTASTPQQALATAQSVVTDLNVLSDGLATTVVALSGCPALNASDSQTVAAGYADAGDTAQAMLSTLIAKHVVFAQFGTTGPIAASLRQLEGASDSYSFTIAELAPSQQTAITATGTQLGNAVANDVSQYEQICIPSPLYPAVQPICISS